MSKKKDKRPRMGKIYRNGIIVGELVFGHHHGHRFAMPQGGFAKYLDDESLVMMTNGWDRPCAACNFTCSTKYGPDPCLGWLPNVEHACCGHGDVSQAYVILESDARYDGREAILVMQGLKELKEQGESGKTN